MNKIPDIGEYISKLDFDVKKLSESLSGNPELIKEFVVYSLNTTREAWRASWVLANYSLKHAEDLNMYAEDFIKSLSYLKIDGHIRETLKIIINLDLTEKQTAEVFNMCMEFLQDNKLQPSVRSIAFQFLINVSKEYPELKNEIIIIFDNIKDYLSDGIKHSMKLRLK